MDENSNKVAVQVPTGLSQRELRSDRTGLLLTIAGGLVIAAAFITAPIWQSFITIVTSSNSRGAWDKWIFVPLGMILVAIVHATIVVLWYKQDQAEYSRSHGSLLSWMVLTALVVFHLGVALLFLGKGPGPKIDTYTFQRDACSSLLQGIDPFGSTQADIYDATRTSLFYGPRMVVNGRVQVGFQYPPLTLLWILPGYFLGDVRYSYIAAIVLSALMAFLLCPTRRGMWVATALLLSPVSFIVERLCWTEPLVLLMLTASIYSAVKKKWWLPIALGLFLATKQYNILALPLIALLVSPFNWKAYLKLTSQSVAIAVLTILPFAILNIRGMWHDLVLFHFAQPFRPDAVSFAVLFPWILKAGPFLLIAFIIWALRAAAHVPAIFTVAYGLSLLLLVSTNKQAFTNYYFLIGSAFLLGVAALPEHKMTLPQPRE